MKRFLWFCCCAVLFPFPLSADVFSLWPFSGRTGSSGVEQTLQGEHLWSEEVVVNGRSLTLDVALVNKTLKEALRDLRGQYKAGSSAMNSNSLLFEVPLSNGARKRYYLVEFGGIVPMIQFSMLLPAASLKGDKIAWPSEFPLPGGATPAAVMEFPKRNSVYGTFRSPFASKQTLSDLAGALRNAGWKSVGKESASPLGSGDVFLRDKPSSILIIGVSPSSSDSSVSTGTIYLRRLK
ncbi:MAG: hypothetical protein BWY31_00330 [Lentisphaerae bacterium ADurb.Bin242]|nr:MAG: hypothetical protein BWY31_00330 [Lentisphaerae bacterium ADurb.Bin242]